MNMFTFTDDLKWVKQDVGHRRAEKRQVQPLF